MVFIRDDDVTMALREGSGLSPDMIKVYETLPGMYLILSADFTIITASENYLSATNKVREEIAGKLLFDVFPIDPGASISSSLNEVKKTLKAHQIPVVRFDLPDPKIAGLRQEKYWQTSHTPILNEKGEIDYIIQFTQDFSELIESKKNNEQNEADLLALDVNLAQGNEEIQTTNKEVTGSNAMLYTSQSSLKITNFSLEESVSIHTGELDKSQKHLDFLLNAMPQQVWTANPNGEINYVNEIICADFGENAEHIIKYGWQRFIHPDDSDTCAKTWAKAVKTGTEYLMEFRLLMRNGKYLWHLGRAIPFMDDGEVKLWMGTNTNIDLQKENEQKKDEFISIASHELKTPLTSIKAFNQLMQRSQSLESMASFLKKSQENIFRLEKLIADLLDVTKINAGKMTYNMQEFSFKQMLIDSVESQQLIAPAHQLILESVEDVTYKGDRFRIEQVLNNFLTNAVKYSPEGGKIIVKSKIELNSLIVSVQDFGIGIAEQDLDKLFNRYYRVDNAAMQFEGLGLGLFISSEILKRHQGSFWIESELGKGSVFYFRLPLDLSNAIKPMVKHDDFYKDQSITIAFNAAKQQLEVDWIGYQNYESVYNGGMMMLEMMAKNNCHKVVNDNRHVLGTWSDATDWARETWFPMMEQAGLEYFAWVYSNSAFSKLSAQRSVDVNMGKVITQFFTDIKLAEEWISKR